MKNKEKIIAYAWGISLIIIVLIGVLLCVNRPNPEIVKAYHELIGTAGKIRGYYSNRPDYWGLNTGAALKQNLHEGVMNNNRILNNLGKPVVIGADSEGNAVMPGQHSFMIGYRGLSRKECIALLSFRWSEEDGLGLLSVSLKNDAGGVYDFVWEDGGLPVSRGMAGKYCGQDNSVMWFFE